ncbi:MAG: LysM peptidoglycan-binding domain-containing protein [Treponemataceae bacterium]
MKRIFLFFMYISFFTAIFYSQSTTYIIKKGETLYSIARRYNTTVDEICRLNNITDQTKIAVDQVIHIPVNTTSEIATVPQHVGRSVVEQDPQINVILSEYTIKKGDTLFSLARKNGIKLDTLRSANEMNEQSVLKVGQRILIPNSDAYIAIKKTPSPTPLPNLPSNISISPSDPRSYDQKKVDANIIWPVKPQDINYVNGKVSSVLITTQKKDKVMTIKSGVVIYTGKYRGFENVVFVHSQNTGHIYVYGGLESISVRKGEKVIFGDEVGIIGIDSITHKPTLNLMVFLNNDPVDPAKAPRG